MNTQSINELFKKTKKKNDKASRCCWSAYQEKRLSEMGLGEMRIGELRLDKMRLGETRESIRRAQVSPPRKSYSPGGVTIFALSAVLLCPL